MAFFELGVEVGDFEGTISLVEANISEELLLVGRGMPEDLHAYCYLHRLVGLYIDFGCDRSMIDIERRTDAITPVACQYLCPVRSIRYLPVLIDLSKRMNGSPARSVIPRDGQKHLSHFEDIVIKLHVVVHDGEQSYVSSILDRDPSLPKP